LNRHVWGGRAQDQPPERWLAEMAGRLKRFLVSAPEKFLEEFDRETRGRFVNRSEAVRAGMAMLLESLKGGRGDEG